MENIETYEVTEQEAMEQWKATCMEWCRAERDKALRDSDYVHMPDVNISEDDLVIMNQYRQELRDFPAVWSELFDNMTEEQKHGVTNLSIQEVLPIKP